MLASIALTVATAGNVAMAGTSVPTNSSTSIYVTQAQAIQDLMAAFSHIPSVPGRPTPDTTYIKVPDSIYPKGDNSQPSRLRYWYNYLMMHQYLNAYQSPHNSPQGLPMPITPTAWVGLKCVFPDVPQNQWASKLGITANAPNAPATAEQVAEWIMDWAKKARNVLPGVRGIPSDPYTLVKNFTGFYGTNVVGQASKVSVGDMRVIGANLYDMSVGYRILSTNRLQILPVLGMSKLNSAYKDRNDIMDKGFQMIEAGITLTFERNGNIIYHRPNVGGMDVSFGEVPHGSSSALKAFRGWWAALGYTPKPTDPEPQFYTSETTVLQHPTSGTFSYTSSGGFVTPQTWKSTTASYAGGISTGAIVTYSNGRILHVNPDGMQYSMYGYPENEN